MIKEIRGNAIKDSEYDSFLKEIFDQIDKENRVFIINPLD
jgi:RecG-like helicase